jgi:hypothetical protein
MARAPCSRWNEKRRRQDDDHQIEPGIANEGVAVWRKHALPDVFRTEREPHDPIDRRRRLSKSDAR